MKQTNLFIFISILFINIFLSGCVKTKEDTYTIVGHIYESCGLPAVNQTFRFYQSGGGAKEAGYATTDATGYFSLTYAHNNGSDLRVGKEAGFGYSDYMHISSNTNYSNIKIYKNASCFLKVSMEVYNSNYTNMDTLYLPDFRENATPPYWYKVPGPFYSKTVYTTNRYILNYKYGGVDLEKLFKVNNTQVSQGSIKLTTCDTINYVLEIR